MQKEKINRKNKGITLIALVITIIVMLILVGVTISVSLNGGLFTTAKEATEETQIAQEKEQLLVAAMGALGEDGEVELEKLDSNLPEGFEKTGEGTYKSSTGNVFTVAINGKITLVGSSSEEEPETPVTPPATPTITITPETITGEIESVTTGIELGTITATVSNVDGDLTWSITPENSGLELADTDNENIKKVTASKAVENATITVSYGEVSDTCNVTVTSNLIYFTVNGVTYYTEPDYTFSGACNQNGISIETAYVSPRTIYVCSFCGAKFTYEDGSFVGAAATALVSGTAFTVVHEDGCTADF